LFFSFHFDPGPTAPHITDPIPFPHKDRSYCPILYFSRRIRIEPITCDSFPPLLALFFQSRILLAIELVVLATDLDLLRVEGAEQQAVAVAGTGEGSQQQA
jgi:hypothetical protein